MSKIIERREEEKERRREEILDAAEAVFADKGMDAATMDQVAKAARVSRALVYVYFRDKEALQLGICIRGLKQLKQMFATARQSAPAGFDQVRSIGQAYMKFAQAYPTYFAALSRFEAQANIDEADTDAAAMFLAGQQVHEETVLALLQGMRDGSIRSDITNPMQTSITLWAFSHGTIQLATTKCEFMSKLGVTQDGFMADALDLAMQALANPHSKETLHAD